MVFDRGLEKDEIFASSSRGGWRKTPFLLGQHGDEERGDGIGEGVHQGGFRRDLSPIRNPSGRRGDRIYQAAAASHVIGLALVLLSISRKLILYLPTLPDLFSDLIRKDQNSGFLSSILRILLKRGLFSTSYYHPMAQFL